MPAKQLNYKSNSVIYFRGDINNNKIFILQSGSVNLNSADIETGAETNEVIQTGEFFGVKSALGKYPREETAVVLTNSAVLAFTVSEFEQFIQFNTRIIMKMLKVFSNQLRRIHKQVRNLLTNDVQQKPETGLFHIGEYYLKNKQNKQALYVFKRYLVYYPSGEFSSKAADYIRSLENSIDTSKGNINLPFVNNAPGTDPQKGRQITDAAKQYFDAVKLMNQQQYNEALTAFNAICTSNTPSEYKIKAELDLGCCYYYTKQWDSCIKYFTSIIQKYPKHPQMRDCLYFIGKSYEDKRVSDKAVSFYQKILSMNPDTNDPIYQKTQKALFALKG